MSNIERLLNTGVETPQTPGEARGGVAAAEWLRHLERAQWAGLGEGFDRNAPTSAAEPRVAEQAAREERRKEAAEGTPASTAAVPIARGPGAAPLADPLARNEDAMPPRSSEIPSRSSEIPTLGVASSGVTVEAGLVAAAGKDAGIAKQVDVTLPAVTHASIPVAAAIASQASAIESPAICIAGARPEFSADSFTAHGGPEPAGVQPGQPSAAIGRRLAAAPLEAATEDSPAAPRPKPAAPRSVRIFTDADGARIVVRDATLDAPTAQALVARIAAELAMGGTRLAEVTINGAKVFEAAPEGAADGGAHAVPRTEEDELGR